MVRALDSSRVQWYGLRAASELHLEAKETNLNSQPALLNTCDSQGVSVLLVGGLVW